MGQTLSDEILNNQEDGSQSHLQELQFPFELKKQIPSSLQLSNKSDNDVAFKVNTTNPKNYYVRPNNGVVFLRSTCDILGQKETPPNMQCKDKFLIRRIDDLSKKFAYEVGECMWKAVCVDPPRASGFSDKERCRKNRENRSKQVIPHIGGGFKLLVKHEEQIEVGLTQSTDESIISSNHVIGRVLGSKHSGRVRFMGVGAAPTDTFRSNGFRPSYLSKTSTDASTSSSNFWQEKYTNLEAAFKAYIVMKDGRIPDQVAEILGSSNSDVVSGV